ncbi:hypothetical protein GFL21_31985 [Rhizobium anhuiense]|nr:hypothetical protein [Rhizobium anhuiense]
MSQFSMGFPHIFYTADKPCQGNYVNNTDLFSCHGDKRRRHPISKTLDPEFAARRQPLQAIIPLIKVETG